MPVADINHYFVRANDLEATRRFYVDVLGFEVMPRPNVPCPGYWLGVNGKIQVHMGPHGIANSELYYLGTPADARNSFMMDLEPSRRAPSRPGPTTDLPCARRASASPSTSGCSGPTTKRSASSSVAGRGVHSMPCAAMGRDACKHCTTTGAAW